MQRDPPDNGSHYVERKILLPRLLKTSLCLIQMFVSSTVFPVPLIIRSSGVKQPQNGEIGEETSTTFLLLDCFLHSQFRSLICQCLEETFESKGMLEARMRQLK